MDCPCCIFLSNDSLISERPRRYAPRIITAVCKRDYSGMEDVAGRWGPVHNLTVRERTFRIYNADQHQRDEFLSALEVLPDFYLSAVPTNLRIGNPRTGRLSVPSGGRVGGGSRRCLVPNPDYEYIIIHPRAFLSGEATPVKMTILHEVGHFVNREYRIAEELASGHREHFDFYRANYHGDSDSDEEVIAQGIMCYFYRLHFLNRLFATEEPPNPAEGRRATLFPQWLLDIIQHDINSRS